ncbi:hypothetical protein, partial [Actinobacillus pleuropneumoniae]|uniref:hypothetical protein n=1 Tax=Actinobacillus pleuropneumoniae TaxID=715 RepID=UPI00227BED47
SKTGEVSHIELTKPDIEELESKFSQTESPLAALVPALAPPSLRRNVIIMTRLPPWLINIEDITGNEEEEKPHSPFT